MCLMNKMTKKAKKAFLKRTPEFVEAYKVVDLISIEGETRFVPPFTRYLDMSFYYKKRNYLSRRIWFFSKKVACFVGPVHKGKVGLYIPYFHLLRHKHEAEAYAKAQRAHVFKCKIPKKYITEIGYETLEAQEVLVTRCFIFDDPEAEKHFN